MKFLPSKAAINRRSPNTSRPNGRFEHRGSVWSACALAPLFVLLGIWNLEFAAFSQVPQNVRARGIQLPWYEGTNITAYLTGQDAEPITGGKGELFVKGFEMKKFRDGTNEAEFFVRAPESFFNPSEKRAWSAKALELFDGATNYFITGEGFFCQQSSNNVSLTISNRVFTRLKRDTNTAAASPPMEVRSDRFEFLSDTNAESKPRRGTYLGHVRVDDPQMGLTAGKLIVDLPTRSNDTRHIVAEQDVVILNKADNSRAAGQRAVYVSDAGKEMITLLGHPVWSDGKNEGHANIMVFDKRSRVVLAKEDAHLKLPRETLSMDAFAGPRTNAVIGTNNFVEVSSDRFDIQLSTNQSARSLVAKQNVVIVSAADKLRATSDEALFEAATGKLELGGNASWKTDQMFAKADTLELDRTNRVFKARQHAYLKMLSPPPKNRPTLTNQFVEILCDSYDLTTNLAKFRGNVRAEFVQGDAPGKLRCEFLDVYLASNQVEKLVARESVFFEQHTTTATNSADKTMSAGLLTLKRSPITGLTTNIVAETNVVMVDVEEAKTNRMERKLSADAVRMRFVGPTNKLESMVGEGNVVIEQDESIATGGLAIYRVNAEGQSFEISEKPQALVVRKDSEGKMQYMLWQGSTLIWDIASGKPRRFGSVKSLSAEDFQALRKKIKSVAR